MRITMNNLIKKKSLLVLICLSTLLCFYTFAAADENDEDWPVAPDVKSEAAILMDASTGTILYEKNINDKHYPASTTKIMTAIVAIENSDPDDTVTFSHDAVTNIEKDATQIGIVEGEKISMKECLYALMLASANEVANGIAEHVSGSCDEFANLMNEYAKEIGCTNTHFCNPNGLHDENHYTTCHDLALIAGYAYRNKLFRTINETKRYTIEKTNKAKDGHTFTNHHQMLTGNKEGFTQYKYDACVGGKTGHTFAAGYTLVTYACKNGETYICVVMNSTAHDQYKDTINLFNYAFDNFKKCDINDIAGMGGVKENNIKLFDRYFEISKYENAISIDSSQSLIIPSFLEVTDIDKKVEFYENPTLETGKNVVGKITFSYNNNTIGEADILFSLNPSSEITNLKMPDNLLTANDKSGNKSEKTLAQKIKAVLKIAGIALGVLLILLLVGIIISKLLFAQKARTRRMLKKEDYYLHAKKKSKDKFKV